MRLPEDGINMLGKCLQPVVAKKIRELSMRLPEDDINVVGKCLQPFVAQKN